MAQKKTSPKFAGFWVRLGSIFIDGLIISSASVVFIILMLRIAHSMLSTVAYLKFYLFFLIPSFFLVTLLYYFWFNANGRQTVGKIFFGLLVIDANGQPINLKISFWRTIAFSMDTLSNKIKTLLKSSG